MDTWKIDRPVDAHENTVFVSGIAEYCVARGLSRNSSLLDILATLHADDLLGTRAQDQVNYHLGYAGAPWGVAC